MTYVLTDQEEFTLQLFGLDSADVQSIRYENIKGSAYVDVFLVPDYDPCPSCGYNEPLIKNYITKKIIHSVLTDRKCILRYHARRYKCSLCGRTYYERNPFTFKDMRISSKTVINVLENLKDFNATYTSVAKEYHISPTTVASIFDRHVHIPRKTLPEYINFDEVYAFRYYDTGRRTMNKYCCVLLDYMTQKPIDILPSRTKDYLVNYFYKIPIEERRKVKICCFDMYTTYREVMKQCFPNAIGIVDYFHLSQELHRKLDRIRLSVMKSYEKDSIEYYLLKKFNWMIYKNYDNLSKKESADFDPAADKIPNRKLNEEVNLYDIKMKLYTIDKTLHAAWELKDRFSDMYKSCTSDTIKKELNAMIKLFMDSSIQEFEDFAKTLCRWKPEIINSFTIIDFRYDVKKSDGDVSAHYIRMNNAIIENRNSIIKCLKKNACGYTNWDRFRNRVLYVLDKDAHFSLNPLPKKDK